jgi:beta-xylosidase
VAKCTTVTGPCTKPAGPIVTSTSTWVGPGHNSVVTGPGGDLYAVYHAWDAAHTTRFPLVDQITWVNGWPEVPGAPSTMSRPSP